MPKSQRASRAKSGKPGAPNPTNNRSSASRKYSERQAARERAALQARRARNRTVGLASVVLVAVIVIALVLVKVAGGGGASAAGASPPAGTPVPAATMAHLASVPLSTLAAAPTGEVLAPQSISDPKLTADGKPDLLYIGAEFCPICATERWAMYVALSKFGTFSPQPGQIHSAVRDGDIQTLTFYKTTYTSPYLTFTPVETTTNQPDGNTYVALQTPTAAQDKLWAAHSTLGTVPFIDFGGKAFLASAQYDPNVLAGVSFADIARDVGNNSTAVGAGIDASAEVLIKTICSTMTGHQPADVCSATGHG
ncbi:MAG: DUF929 family protein [Acidimicrobiales bacterium]